jgi:branched-chain amino acid transport system ATP-binding protein
MLEISNLGVRYGRHQALADISIRIAKGEICVILGANGAGKSSLLNAIAGVIKVEPGSQVVMNGRQIAGMKPHRIVEQGIALVPEGRGIFADLTVAENLQLGAFTSRARIGEAEVLRRVYALFPRLAERRSQFVRTMSGGEQQMVAIGRALMSQPEVLMLDEPSLGLSPMLTKELFRSLTTIAATGVGILLVEQNARQSLKIVERGYLIENGHLVGEGSAQKLLNDPAVINAYLGGRGAAQPTKHPIRLPPPFLLPGKLASICRQVGALAARATAIQAAFVRNLRRESPLPSAFVGRYDPASGGDPWAELAKTASQGGAAPWLRVSAEGRQLGEQAAAMARAAAERHANHIQTRRPVAPRSTPVTTAAASKTGAAVVRGALPDAEMLARAAAQRMVKHVRHQREKHPLPSAFVLGGTAPDDATDVVLPGLGHNSANFGIDAERSGEAIDIPVLVARATAVLSEHLMSRRKSLAIHTFRPRPSAETTDSDPKQSPRRR